MVTSLNTIWYTACSVPHAFALAMELGEIVKDFRSLGIQLKELGNLSVTDTFPAYSLVIREDITAIDSLYPGQFTILGVNKLERQRLLDTGNLRYDTDYRDKASLIYAVSNDLIRDYPEWVDRLLAHILSASQWATRNPEEANRLLAKGLLLSELLVTSAYSEKLYEQLGLSLTPTDLAALHLRSDIPSANGNLQDEARLESSADFSRIAAAEQLLTTGKVNPPRCGGVSKYARQDVPSAYFTDREPARIIQSDEEAIRIAKVYAEEIQAGASERDRNRVLPFDEIRKLAESGLLGIIVPKAYGGPGVSTKTLTEVFKIISAADGSIGQIPQNHHFFVKIVELNGTEEQKSFFFKQILQGAQIGNAIAEKGTLHFEQMSTRLIADGRGKYRLNGVKHYATGSLFSSWISLFARDEADKIVAAFVPRDSQGLIVIDDWAGIGQRTTASGRVVFQDVEIPPEYVVPHWKTFESPQYFNSFGQIMHAAIDIGIAKAALHDAGQFVRERSRPLIASGVTRAADEPYLISRFGELGISLIGAEALLEKAAVSIDAAHSQLNETTAGEATVLVDSVKYLATDAVIEITNALFEVSGSSSMDEKYNLDRHWRNGRTHTLHDPARWKLNRVGNWVLNGIYPVDKY